ncbi:MAG: class I SAM-dependent methyltransferase [Terracidiphilus sp.]
MLSERVAREKAAYDEGDVYANSHALQTRYSHVFRCPNSQHAEQHLDRLVAESAENRDILDYGCLDGAMTPRYLEMKPRSIAGIDISTNGVARANANWGHAARFSVGDVHCMPFPDRSFDVVVGRSILHHLELPLAYKEILRVLRPGGRAIFMEPLGDNPGAKILRAVTPATRTKDEKALSRSDIDQADSLFAGSCHLFFNLVSVPAAMLTSLTPLRPDNLLLRIADQFDRRLARTPLKYWMRSVVLCWRAG